MAMLETDDECAKIIRSVLTARDERAGNQLSGVVSSLQIDFATLNDPNLTYVLSGDDFDLNINDPKHPKVICVGTDNHIAAALSPIISLIFSVALKQMNEQGKHHSFCLLDEAAQINIPRLSNVPATCRSNKLSVVFMAQNLTQIEDKYGKPEAESLLANLNYQFFTRTTVFSTAEYISRMIGETKLVTKSENQSHSSKGLNSTNNSIGNNFSEIEKRAVKPQDVLNLQAGEIVGIRAIEPSDIKVGTIIPTFKMKVIREIFKTIDGMNGEYKKDGSFQTHSKPIPSFNQPVDIEVMMNKIAEDCKKMLRIS
jgi:type IV secretory pathway TraG/TraD family ATPase VirD4